MLGRPRRVDGSARVSNPGKLNYVIEANAIAHRTVVVRHSR
jgi:hypothetical protein